MNKKPTKNYINLLKFIAMIFVVCMHVISKAMPNYEYTSTTYKIMLFIDILLRSSVPLFIFISGNLMLNKKYTIKQVLYKLIKYYLLFIVFNSMYKIVDCIMIQHESINIINILVDELTLKSIYQMWYFKLLLLTYASVPIFQYLISKNNKILDTITLTILIILFIVMPYIIGGTYFEVSYYLVFLLYYYLGYYIKKYEFKYENILFLIIFGLSYYYTYSKSVVLDHDYYYLNFQLINTLLIGLSIFKIFSVLEKYLTNDKLNNIFKYLASYSFYIFIFHGLVIGLLSKINVINIYSYNNLLLIISNTIIVYVCTLVLSIVLKNVKEIVIKMYKKIIK